MLLEICTPQEQDRRKNASLLSMCYTSQTFSYLLALADAVAQQSQAFRLRKRHRLSKHKSVNCLPLTSGIIQPFHLLGPYARVSPLGENPINQHILLRPNPHRGDSGWTSIPTLDTGIAIRLPCQWQNTTFSKEW